MKFLFKDNATQGELLLTSGEEHFDRLFFVRDRHNKYLTIAWNRGASQEVTIDEVSYEFPANTILPLVVNQSFSFEHPENITAWQFNRDFYCIMDHDKEVSCVGFIFYGTSETMFIKLDEKEQENLSALLKVFEDELENEDDIQATMLRMLLVRLIIKITRLGKKQYLSESIQDDSRYDMIRQFNLLVEQHFKQQHQVQFYANELAKSPKTLSNVFALYNHKSPLQVIQQRLILEAKRLSYYTSKSAKEIAAELGFEDAAHFSRFFKNQTGSNITDFKKQTETKMTSSL